MSYVLIYYCSILTVLFKQLSIRTLIKNVLFPHPFMYCLRIRSEGNWETKKKLACLGITCAGIILSIGGN